MVALVAGYALIAVVAAAPDSPLTPPLPPRVAAPAGLAHAARWLGLDRLGRFGLTVLSICVLAGLVSSFLVVLADDVGGRAIPVWLNGPEGHSLFRGDGDHPTPSPPR